MKISFLPKTKNGKWSAVLFAALIIFLAYFFLMVNVFGQRGGQTFFSNLNLTIPMMLAWLSGMASFILGLMAFFKDKSVSVLVICVVVLSFLTTIYGIAAVL